MSNITLKPSLLVARSISRKGGIGYTRKVLGEEQTESTETKTWEVTRLIDNVKELKAANVVVTECRRMVDKWCVATSFGLLCPKENKAALYGAFDAVRAKLKEANATFATCHIVSAFVTGDIVSDETEAAQQLTRDIQEFFETLQTAITACDVKAIRRTVLEMKGVEQLLPDLQSKALSQAMQTARSIASTITQEVEKKGRQIDEVRNELNLAEIDVARIAFVEVGAPVEIEPVGAPVAEQMEAVEIGVLEEVA